MQKRQSDNKITKQIRIDAGLHKLVKIEATKVSKSIKEFLEDILVDYLDVIKEEEE